MFFVTEKEVETSREKDVQQIRNVVKPLKYSSREEQGEMKIRPGKKREFLLNSEHHGSHRMDVCEVLSNSSILFKQTK